MYNKR